MVTRKYICPSCNQKSGVAIIYGEPSLETIEKAKSNDIALGGCCVSDDSPNRECLSCGHQWRAERRAKSRLTNQASNTKALPMPSENNSNSGEGTTIQNVESMVNNIQNVENINNHYYDNKPPRPVNKIIPLSEAEGGLSLKQKTYFRETINKVWELGKITKNSKATHAIVRDSVNRAGGVTTVNLYPADRYWDGVIELEIWLSPMLVHEKVIENPPEWWRSHLMQAVHIWLERNGTEAAFQEWLKTLYGVESMDELDDSELAEAYKARKNKFVNPKEKQHPRDFENRLSALIRFFDEAEEAGLFDRTRIPWERRELLEALQATDRTLFSLSESTFETFLKQAKKQLAFGFKRGTRSPTRLKPGRIRG
jgi:hypothetical protein